MNSRTSGMHSEMSTRHAHSTGLSGPADPSQLIKEGCVLYALESMVYSAIQYLKKDSSNSVLYSLLKPPLANSEMKTLSLT